MVKFIPYEKLSKKKRRELDKKRRNDWGVLRPVTRKIESGKNYKRKKAKPEDADFAFAYSFFFRAASRNRAVTISM